MFVENLCSPAILYLGFSLTQIVIDMFKGMYNTAIVKTAVAVVFTTILNMLCSRGLTTISWFIVFIPFVTMTFVTGVLMYLFGLAPFTGKLKYSEDIKDKPLPPPQKNPAVDRGNGPQDPKDKPIKIQPVTEACDAFTEKVVRKPDGTIVSKPGLTDAKTSGEVAVNCAKAKQKADNVFVLMKQNIEAFGNNFI